MAKDFVTAPAVTSIRVSCGNAANTSALAASPSDTVAPAVPSSVISASASVPANESRLERASKNGLESVVIAHSSAQWISCSLKLGPVGECSLSELHAKSASNPKGANKKVFDFDIALPASGRSSGAVRAREPKWFPEVPTHSKDRSRR